MAERLEKADFADNVNTKYRIRLDDSNFIELELTSIEERESPPTQEQFSLIFEGPNIYLPQHIYQMEHERMGTIDLFLVPIGKKEDKFIYESVFNRLIK